MQTVAQFKTRADRLRTHLLAQGHKITRAVALEAQAVQEGVRDWNTLSAMAPSDKGPGKRGKTSVITRQFLHPQHGYQQLAAYIGKELPDTWSPALKIELGELEAAVKESIQLSKRWKTLTPHDWSLMNCSGCGSITSSKPDISECVACDKKYGPRDFVVVAELLKDLQSFLAVRWALSISLMRPVLGFKPYVAFDHCASPLERVCQQSFSGVVSVAAAEFGLEEHLGTRWLDRHNHGCELGLSYYPDTEAVTSLLSSVGISSRQAKSLGWTKHYVTESSHLLCEPFGLVVTFIEDAEGGPASFWGYRPKSLRAREGIGSDSYLVSDNYPKDAVYLSHLIDARPLVLITRFMHAISLREHGVNAVAVPYLSLMSASAVSTVMEGHEMIVVCASKAPLDSRDVGMGIFSDQVVADRIRFMDSLETYDGRKGFLIDQFLADLKATLAEQPGPTTP